MGAVCGGIGALAVLVLCAVLSTHAALTLAADLAAGDNYSLSYHAIGSDCRGPIAECLSEMEFGMESESTRRMLAAAAGTISYDALRRNSAPCSKRGKSYYSNCTPGGPVNPYHRDCTKITLCRS